MNSLGTLSIKLKQLYLKFFTNLPYRVASFEDVFNKVSCKSDYEAESRTQILKKEQGETLFYRSSEHSINQNSKPDKQEKRDFSWSGIFVEPNRYIFSLENGIIFGQLGVVYESTTRLFIEESAQEWNLPLRNSKYTRTIKYPAKKFLKGITLSCVTNGADGGFYHFFFEALPKLFLCRDLLHQINHFIFNGIACEWKLKWLRQIGIDLSKIVWMENSGHYQCDQLLFTNKVVADQQINRWCVSGLKKLLNWDDKIVPDSDRKIIWITRTNVKQRVITWEDELLSKFPEIQKIDFTSLSVGEAIQILSSASCVIGPHGAGLSNILFCRPGTKILELFPENAAVIPCYLRLSSVCGLNHQVTYLDFNDCNNDSYGLVFAEQLLKAYHA